MQQALEWARSYFVSYRLAQSLLPRSGFVKQVAQRGRQCLESPPVNFGVRRHNPVFRAYEEQVNSAFVLKNYWATGIESILVDSERPFVVGDIVRTTELWAGHLGPVECVTQVEKYEVVNDDHTLELMYSSSRNPDILSLCMAWGQSTISFILYTGKAAAVWHSNPPAQEFDGPAKSGITSSRTREFLGLIATIRRRRRQDKFKRELLEIDRRCALSGKAALSSLQAAHIVEVADGGCYTPSNGILLRADIHCIFDGRFLIVNDDGTITLNPDANLDSRYIEESKTWKLNAATFRRIHRTLRERILIESS